jgi:hypothetical protein
MRPFSARQGAGEQALTDAAHCGVIGEQADGVVGRHHSVLSG